MTTWATYDASTIMQAQMDELKPMAESVGGVVEYTVSANNEMSLYAADDAGYSMNLLNNNLWMHVAVPGSDETTNLTFITWQVNFPTELTGG